MVGNYLYWPTTSGTFERATFNGSTLGTPQVVDPYDDPTWRTVDGFGQTYQSSPPSYYSKMNSITGEFYSAGKLYYTLAGQPTLYWRWFSPDSGIVGAAEHSNPAAALADVEGMTLSGSTLYYSGAADGSLYSVAFANDVPTGREPRSAGRRSTAGTGARTACSCTGRLTGAPVPISRDQDGQDPRR